MWGPDELVGGAYEQVLANHLHAAWHTHSVRRALTRALARRRLKCNLFKGCNYSNADAGGDDDDDDDDDDDHDDDDDDDDDDDYDYDDDDDDDDSDDGDGFHGVG